MAENSSEISTMQASMEYTVTSQSIGKCEKDGDEYMVDRAVIGYRMSSHWDADRTQSGCGKSDSGREIESN